MTAPAPAPAPADGLPDRLPDRLPDTDALHPLLAGRWSPRGFDPEARLSREQLRPLLEAARWAPSSGNGQTTRWAVALRGEPRFSALFDALKPGNRTWAGRASALLVSVAVEADEDGRPRATALHDAGQAVAHLSLQAVAEGLHTHQMAGYDASALHALLGLPDRMRPVVVVAVGVLGGPALPEDLAAREQAPRVRVPLEDLLL